VKQIDLILRYVAEMPKTHLYEPECGKRSAAVPMNILIRKEVVAGDPPQSKLRLRIEPCDE
jgi:hypothetical protein